MPYKAQFQGHRQRPIDFDWLRKKYDKKHPHETRCGFLSGARASCLNENDLPNWQVKRDTPEDDSLKCAASAVKPPQKQNRSPQIRRNRPLRTMQRPRPARPGSRSPCRQNAAIPPGRRSPPMVGTVYMQAELARLRFISVGDLRFRRGHAADR